MIIMLRDWRIRSYYLHGYVIEQKKTKAGWRVERYYTTLAQAAQDLFEERIRAETSDSVILAENLATARVCTAEIISKLEAIADELCDAVSAGRGDNE